MKRVKNVMAFVGSLAMLFVILIPFFYAIDYVCLNIGITSETECFIFGILVVVLGKLYGKILEVIFLKKDSDSEKEVA